MNMELKHINFNNLINNENESSEDDICSDNNIDDDDNLDISWIDDYNKIENKYEYFYKN